MQTISLQKVTQSFESPLVEDVKGTTRAEWQRVADHFDWKGKTVAITAGSRGIAGIVDILCTTIEFVQERGAIPFIVPAMGSHGGGTVEGQLEMLSSLGITEESMGIPIRATVEAVQVGEVEVEGYFGGPVPVYQNRHAFESDVVVVINRVKTHTSFKSNLESGLSKMIAVGLGNPIGAANIHRFGVEGMKRLIEPMARLLLEQTPIQFGLAIIENAQEETADIVAVTKAEWVATEEKLLVRSKSLMPSLPFEEIDVLIVEEMGKCFSGTGVDTNIIGRLRIPGQQEPSAPRVTRIVVLDLADCSHGNATGVGLVDIITQKLADKIDRKATYLNVMSTTFVERAMIPMTAPSEEQAVGWAIRSLGEVDITQLRVVRIRNTLHIGELWVSAPLLSGGGASTSTDAFTQPYDTSM